MVDAVDDTDDPAGPDTTPEPAWMDALNEAYQAGAGVGSYGMLVGIIEMIDEGQSLRDIRAAAQEMVDEEFPDIPDAVKDGLRKVATDAAETVG